MQTQMPFVRRDREVVTIADGAVWLKQWLSVDQQRALVEQCRAIMHAPFRSASPDQAQRGFAHQKCLPLRFPICRQQWHVWLV